jgi:hypothetical protein
MFTIAHHKKCGGEVEMADNRHPQKLETWICTRCGKDVGQSDLSKWETFLLSRARLSSPHPNQIGLEQETNSRDSYGKERETHK